MQQNLQSELSIERNIEAKADAEGTKSAPIELTASLLKLVAGGAATQLPNALRVATTRRRRPEAHSVQP